MALTITLIMIILHPPTLSNKKASNKKLDSQISYFSRRIKDLITKSNENSLLKNKRPRLSLEKSSFLLDRRGCNQKNKEVNGYHTHDFHRCSRSSLSLLSSSWLVSTDVRHRHFHCYQHCELYSIMLLAFLILPLRLI